MRTSAIVAIAGVLAVSAGLLTSADIVRNESPRTSASHGSQNNASLPLTVPTATSAPSPIASAPIAIGATLGATAQPSIAPSPIPATTVKPVGSTMRMLNGHPVVYITFDDGPSLTHTPLILAALARHHAHATFFVEGRFAHRYPELIVAELAAGHSVGNHTWSHPHLATLSEAAIRYQLKSTRYFLRTLGANGQCVRPPFGETSALVHKVESSMGIHEYLWTTETKDWMHTSAAHDVQRASAGLKPGAVIVFHDGRASGSPQSVAAVDRFLTQVDALGYVALPLPC